MSGARSTGLLNAGATPSWFDGAHHEGYWESGTGAVLKKQASYGWGVIPVRAEIAGVAFETSLFPKDGTYLLPLAAAVRKRIGVTAGDIQG